MFRQKEGLPEESDIVLCTVTKIHFHSVFARLNEYGHLSGMIHISEISPGRIRNLNDYVKEGKVIVCKVLRVNEERNQIDLSLRRVSEHQRRTKIDQIKQENIAEKILEFVAKKHKKETRELYDLIGKKVFDDYDSLYDMFEDYVAGEVKLEDYVPKSLLKDLDEIIRQRIKEPNVCIKGEISIKSYAPEGIENIKDALNSAFKVDKENITVNYLGAGKHKIQIMSKEYPVAEKLLKKTIDSIKKKLDKKSEFDFKRIE
ncbi:S1 RNA-binding domain-containing protein [Candidatus Woesearchaeota archaeon]|nr:S1 RNA-binding domain-containing protein [Candidatus Woesearchaeota archaeon]